MRAIALGWIASLIGYIVLDPNLLRRGTVALEQVEIEARIASRLGSSEGLDGILSDVSGLFIH
jgi:hypothetical protein